MFSVLVVTACPTSFVSFAVFLDGKGAVRLSWATNSGQALEQAALEPPDLVVVDDQSKGLAAPELLRRLASLDPRINTAVSSPLAPGVFRRVYQGLGTMGQLPLRPGRGEARDLLERLPRLAASA